MPDSYDSVFGVELKQQAANMGVQSQSIYNVYISILY